MPAAARQQQQQQQEDDFSKQGKAGYSQLSLHVSLKNHLVYCSADNTYNGCSCLGLIPNMLSRCDREDLSTATYNTKVQQRRTFLVPKPKRLRGLGALHYSSVHASVTL
jgi:hypothetical protein